MLVFEPSLADAAPGSATPFDTGGLCHGKVHADSIRANDPASARDYLDRHRLPLSGWRPAFAGYLSRHFHSPASYVRGERAHTDDATGRLLHPDNQRRAWTWEVQLESDHDLRQDVRFFLLAQDIADALRDTLSTLPDDEAAPWEDLMHDPGRFRTAPASTTTPVLCTMAEEEIASWL